LPYSFVRILPVSTQYSNLPAIEKTESEVKTGISEELAVKKLEPLYTVSEAAKILNVSEKTVRRLIKDEVLRAIDFRRENGRRGTVRVAPADLEDFIRDHRSR
jgi:excisionase family DNA binding protein